VAKGFAAILSLPPERLEALNQLLLDDGPTEAARVLQEEWGAFPELKRLSLKRQLIRYKLGKLAPDAGARVVEAVRGPSRSDIAHVGRRAVAAVARLESSVDALATMEWAVGLQVKRVKRLQEFEDKLKDGECFSEQARNLQLLTYQLDALAKLQLEVGVLKRVPKNVNVGFDLPAEEAKFAEAARLHAVESEATAEAIRVLAEAGFLALPEGEAAQAAAAEGAEVVDSPAPAAAEGAG